MGQLVKNFLRNFQDLYVHKKTTIDQFPEVMTNIELQLLDTQLESIKTDLEALDSLTLEASKEVLIEYKKVVEILEEKIEYVADISNMFMYLNSFYDMNNVVDLSNYSLKNIQNNENLIYDNQQKGLTLRSRANTYQCIKVLNATSITFYNTNLSYHSGISLDSDYLSLLDIKSISVRKVDGTILKLDLNNIDSTTYYLRHEYLTSTQIIIDLNVDINALPLEQRAYYEDLELSLIDYTYVSYGDMVFDNTRYKSSDLFNIIYNCNLPNNTYSNLILNIVGLDINQNVVNTISYTLPLSSPLTCKRLDNINFNEVKEITGIYLNNKFTSTKNVLNKEFLESRTNKNEYFVIYKSTSNNLNNSYKLLNSQGLKINNKNINELSISCSIELYSFNENSSPLITMLTGVTKFD